MRVCWPLDANALKLQWKQKRSQFSSLINCYNSKNTYLETWQTLWAPSTASWVALSFFAGSTNFCGVFHDPQKEKQKPTKKCTPPTKLYIPKSQVESYFKRLFRSDTKRSNEKQNVQKEKKVNRKETLEGSPLRTPLKSTMYSWHRLLPNYSALLVNCTLLLLARQTSKKVAFKLSNLFKLFLSRAVSQIVAL